MNEMSARIVTPTEAEMFFKHVESLGGEAIRREKRSRRVAWGVAGCAFATAILSCYTLAAMGPQHSVEWRLVRVDSSTGRIDEVESLRAAPKTLDEANLRALLFRYVMERETYAAPEAEFDYHAVNLQSTADEQDRYDALVSGKNPHSPQVVAGKGGFITADIKSVAMLAPGLGQVRFSSTLAVEGQEPKTTHWMATIGFLIKPEAKMSNADRLINPTGFLVSEYRVVQDKP